MQLLYESLGFDGQDEESYVTEVVLMEHESRSRALLEAGIRRFEIAYDETVFPERIVLIGRYSVKSVHEIITKQNKPVEMSKPPSPLPGKSVEQVHISDKYL